MVDEALQRRIASAHQSTDFDDWWLALFTASCAETGDPEKALEVTEKLYAKGGDEANGA